MASPIVHWELTVPDTTQARAFYRIVFDWIFDDTTFLGHTLIHTRQDPHGGLMVRRNDGSATGLNSYVEVDDVQSTLHEVVEWGGKVVVPRTEISNVGEFAVFQDPEGVAVPILHPARH